MSQVHTPQPPLVGRAHVDLCRRTAAACRLLVTRSATTRMPKA